MKSVKEAYLHLNLVLLGFLAAHWYVQEPFNSWRYWVGLIGMVAIFTLIRLNAKYWNKNEQPPPVKKEE